MKSEPTGRRAGRRQKPGAVVATDASSAAHAEIVRMAAAEADHRHIERRAMIADAAYFRAEKRGYAPGREFDDWLAAEIEVANIQQLGTLALEEAGGLRRVS